MGYAHANSDVKNIQRKMDVASDNIFLYGQYQPNEWHTSLVFNYGSSTYKDKSLLTSEYDSDSYSAQLIGGYKKGVFDTIAGIRYTMVKTDDYTNGLTIVKSDNTHLATLLLGTKFSKDFISKENIMWTPELWATGSYDVKSDASSAVVGVVGSTTNYRVLGKRLNRAAIEAGMAISITWENLEVKTSYVAELRPEHNSQTLNLKAIYNF